MESNYLCFSSFRERHIQLNFQTKLIYILTKSYSIEINSNQMTTNHLNFLKKGMMIGTEFSILTRASTSQFNIVLRAKVYEHENHQNKVL